MRAKKIMAALLAMAFSATALTTAMAAAPSAYDGQPYESVGYTSDDPDGEINLAVIANGKVDIVGDAMYIKGSVYSNDTIYVGNGAGNKVDGLFISGVKGMWDYKTPGDGASEDQYRLGYIHVDDDHQMTTNAYSTTLDYEGAILDTETSFDYSYTPYEIPEIANTVDNLVANQYYPGAVTIDEDTHFGTLEIQGKGLIIDTTNGDVTVVVDTLNFRAGDAEILVKGENKVNFYVVDSNTFDNFNLSFHAEDIDVWSLEGAYAGFYNYKEPPSWQPVNPVETYFEGLGNPDQINLYLGEAGDSIVLNGGRVAMNLYSNADSFKIGGSARVKGVLTTGAANVIMDGEGTYFEGQIVAPNAETLVSGSATVLGQVITDTLTNNGAGQIVYKADTGVQAAEKEEPTEEPTEEPAEPTVEPTEAPAEPTEEPTPEPTKAPVPQGSEVVLSGGYAYIFGDEPGVDENGNPVPEIYMSPDRNVSREELCAMVMRMIDQEYNTKGTNYPLTEKLMQYKGMWYARGLAYMASQGAFDDVPEVGLGAVTRGEVAKLITFGLNLDAANAEATGLADVEGNPYQTYIEIVYGYGYMNGRGGEFAPNDYMTRAEFCQLFNNIIGRTDMGLTTVDGEEVTPETYSIVDLNDPNFWGTDAMLKATSAYNDEGLIDLNIRQQNIRNVLDNYDSQIEY